ncbi:MAG: 3-isopropylmalate dehydrogenase [Desulfobacteraceae bacterium 4572_35.1]|nr:MAG: 3-isopropylmalate dehydrogenase [Desulfobacteraceae bacterium 4572_35.1]
MAEKSFKVAVLPGDGIGPEVMTEALKVLAAIEDKYSVSFDKTMANVGGAGIDKEGKALPETTIDICKSSDAILFGSVGGPKWETLPPDEQPERGALLPLRKIFGLFCNLRPAIIFPALTGSSSLKESVIEGGFNILVVRELTGGIYFSEPKGIEEVDGVRRGFDTMLYTEPEIERITRVAFDVARKRGNKVCSIDKANVLSTSVVWRDVVVLSDEAAMLTGSLGMLPSASLAEGSFGMYEPSGGSAPDIAGQGIANPIAQILSAAMMLRYSFSMNDAADAVEAAVEKVLTDGYRTGDIYQGTDSEKKVNTCEMGDAIVAAL